MQDIWDALESTTGGKRQDIARNRANASKQETRNWRDALLRFLDEIDGNLSVAEVREALEEYS